MSIKEKYNLDEQDVDRIIEMAWEDRTPNAVAKSKSRTIRCLNDNF